MNDLAINTLLMDIGTWLLAVACIPQLRSVLKNRHNLRGFSIPGALTISIGLVFISIAFVGFGMWVSLIAQLVPLTNWFLTAYYTIKCRNKE